MAAKKAANKAQKGKKNPGKVTIRRNGETKTLYGAAAQKVLNQRKAKGKATAKRNAAKPAKKKAAKKKAKRNAASYSSATPIAVTQHFRSGGPDYATKRERIIRAGQRDLFAPQASQEELLSFLKKNPSVLSAVKKRLGAEGFRTASNAKLKQTMTVVIREAQKGQRNPDARALNLAAQEAARIKQEIAFWTRQLERGSRADKEEARGALAVLKQQLARVQNLRERASKNPRYLVEGHGRELGILVAPNATQATARAKTIYGKGTYKATKTAQQDFIGGTAATVKKARAQQAKKTVKKAGKKNAAPRHRRNPEAGQLYEMFTGQPSSGYDIVSAPNGAPANVDQLGQFLRFKWQDWDGKVYSVELEKNGVPALLGVSRNKDGYDTLYALGDFVLDMPPGDHGYITRIEYRAQKLHLGDDAPRVYYHDLGEETGEPPVLRVDKEGRMIFRDGAYWIEDRGIVN